MDKSDKTGKLISLTFAIVAVLIFVGIGIALSYRNLWLALFLFLASVVFIGLGFIVKARSRR